MSDTKTDPERARRLLAVIAEHFEDLDLAEYGDGYCIEFFEPARDWQALLAEVERLREALRRIAAGMVPAAYVPRSVQIARKALED